MTLQQLRYVIEISKCNSISKAAHSLFMTQPSLSKAVKDLEQELNLTIFERINRGIQFTPDGLELLCYAKQVLEQVDSIKERFTGKQKQEELYLSISAQHYVFTAEAVIQLLNQMGETPYEMHVREGQTSQVIDDISNQRSSIGIIFLSGSTERFMRRLLASKGIVFNRIAEMNPHVFLSQNHPLAHENYITTEQLAKYPCLSYGQGQDSLNFAEEVLITGKASQMVYVSDRATTTNILARTLCYNVGTGCLLGGTAEQGIVSIPLAGHKEHMQIGWIQSKSLSLQSEIKTFLELLQEAIKKCSLHTEKE